MIWVKMTVGRDYSAITLADIFLTVRNLIACTIWYNLRLKKYFWNKKVITTT